jgi:hypothetical protein
MWLVVWASLMRGTVGTLGRVEDENSGWYGDGNDAFKVRDVMM